MFGDPSPHTLPSISVRAGWKEGDLTIKLVFNIRRRDCMMREEFQRYWRQEHGRLVMRRPRRP
jgi:hypothetical protein